MDYEQFINRMKEHMEELLPSNTKCEIEKKDGNTTLLLQYEGENYSFHMTPQYESYLKGSSIRCILLSMIERMKRINSMNKDKTYCIGIKLINYEKHKEKLQNIRHEIYLDLAVVYYNLLDGVEIFQEGSLNESDSKEIVSYHKAMENTINYLGINLNTMEDILFSMIYEEDIEYSYSDVISNITYKLDKDKTMYVLTNKKKLYGAITLLYPQICEVFAARMDSNFFILPSSVHELILIPDKGEIDKEDLANMVYEINRSEVLPKDFLSDSIYYYDKKDSKVIIL